MLNPSNGAGQAEGLPLTFKAAVRAASEQRAQRPGHQPRIHVQVRRFDPQGPYVLCGRLVEMAEHNGELFAVETAIGRQWVTGKNVRLCSGDGRCSCEAEWQERERG